MPRNDTDPLAEICAGVVLLAVSGVSLAFGESGVAMVGVAGLAAVACVRSYTREMEG